MQDNGSWGGPAYVLKDQGIRNSYWQELMFGDGFDVVPDPKDSVMGMQCLRKDLLAVTILKPEIQR